MKMQKRFLKIGNILNFVFAFLYFVLTAAFYAISNSFYILFLIISILLIVSGLCSEYIEENLEGNGFNSKQRVILLIITIVSIPCLVSSVLYLLAFLSKDSTNVEYKKIEEKKVVTKETDKKFFKRKSTFVALASFLTILLSSFTGFALETSGFKVEINKFTLTKEMTEKYSEPICGTSYVIKSDEMKYVVNEYKPKEASERNKYPAIFISCGYTRSKEAMSHFALELSKRGSICYVLDSACHGESTYGGYYFDSKGVETKVGTSDGQWGLQYLVSYIYNNKSDFNYVDRDKLGAIGHSQGGAATMNAAAKFNEGTYESSIFKAIQISGYCTNLNYYSGLYRCNAMLTWGMLEEGYPQGSYESYFSHFVNNANGYGIFQENNIEIGKGYGDMSQGNYRIVTRPNGTHFLTIYCPENVEAVCNFMQEALDFKNPIAGNKQTWIIKEITSFISFMAAFVLIFAVAKMLTNLCFFKLAICDEHLPEPSIIKTSDGKERIKGKSLYSKIKFWTTTLLSAIIACLDYYPCCMLGLEIFEKTAGANYSFEFPCKMLNGVMIWAAINGLIGLALFFIPKLVEYIVFRVKNKENKDVKFEAPELKQLKMGILPLLANLALSVILIVVFFLMVRIVNVCFHQEFRALMVICSPINIRALAVLPIYLPCFFIFYASNSIRVNLGIFYEGFSETKSTIIAILANSIGLVFLLFIQYFKIGYSGTPFWTDTTYTNVIFGVVIMMALLPVINRQFYKITKNPWLGAIVAVVIFIYISISSTCNLVPISF